MLWGHRPANMDAVGPLLINELEPEAQRMLTAAKHDTHALVALLDRKLENVREPLTLVLFARHHNRRALEAALPDANASRVIQVCVRARVC